MSVIALEILRFPSFGIVEAISPCNLLDWVSKREFVFLKKLYTPASWQMQSNLLITVILKHVFTTSCHVLGGLSALVGCIPFKGDNVCGNLAQSHATAWLDELTL